MAKKANGAAREVAHSDETIIELAADTLLGDIRDAILTEFKGMPKPWQQMTEDEQERLIWRAQSIANALLCDTAKIIAHKGFGHVVCKVEKFTFKDGVKIEASADGSVETVTKLASHHGTAVLVLAEANVYQGERAKAEPDVVGDLAMPKGEQPADGRADEAALQQVGKGRQPAAAQA